MIVIFLLTIKILGDFVFYFFSLFDNVKGIEISLNYFLKFPFTRLQAVYSMRSNILQHLIRLLYAFKIKMFVADN